MMSMSTSIYLTNAGRPLSDADIESPSEASDHKSLREILRRSKIAVRSVTGRSSNCCWGSLAEEVFICDVPKGA